MLLNSDKIYLDLVYNKGRTLASCCEEKGVPDKCIGSCMGNCKDTSWKTYIDNIDPQNACAKHQKVIRECCQELGN